MSRLEEQLAVAELTITQRVQVGLVSFGSKQDSRKQDSMICNTVRFFACFFCYRVGVPRGVPHDFGAKNLRRMRRAYQLGRPSS